MYSLNLRGSQQAGGLKDVLPGVICSLIMLASAPSAIGQGHTLKITTPKVAPGRLIVVECAGPTPRNKHAWVGFYSKEADHKRYLAYTFLQNLTANTYDAVVPEEPGLYNFRLFANEGYTPSAISDTIQVKADGVATVILGTGTSATSNLAPNPPATPTVNDLISASGQDTPGQPGTEVGPAGGGVENAQAGIKMTIPPGALKEGVSITIAPQVQHPPIFDEPLPAELNDVVWIGPVFDFGPSGTQFQIPIEVRWRLPDDQMTWLRDKGGSVEVGYYNGKTWQPCENVQANADGTVSFQTTHFTPFTAVMVKVALTAGVVAVPILRQILYNWGHPWEYIKSSSPAVKKHIADGKVHFPDKQKLDQGVTTSLGLGLPKYKGVVPYVFISDGETMLTRETAFCQEATFVTASILKASGDPRFQNFICVGGKMTEPGTGETGGHMWIEIEVDGKHWVVDTYRVGDISLVPKEKAYKGYKLKPGKEFTETSTSWKPYEGLEKPAGNTGSDDANNDPQKDDSNPPGLDVEEPTEKPVDEPTDKPVDEPMDIAGDWKGALTFTRVIMPDQITVPNPMDPKAPPETMTRQQCEEKLEIGKPRPLSPNFRPTSPTTGFIVTTDAEKGTQKETPYTLEGNRIVIRQEQQGATSQIEGVFAREGDQWVLNATVEINMASEGKQLAKIEGDLKLTKPAK